MKLNVQVNVFLALVCLLITSRPAAPQSQIAKEGQCPNVEGKVGICVEMCQSDGDCEADRKCCSNGCGHTCVAPVKTGTGGFIPDPRCTGEEYMTCPLGRGRQQTWFSGGRYNFTFFRDGACIVVPRFACAAWHPNPGERSARIPSTTNYFAKKLDCEQLCLGINLPPPPQVQPSAFPVQPPFPPMQLKNNYSQLVDIEKLSVTMNDLTTKINAANEPNDAETLMKASKCLENFIPNANELNMQNVTQSTKDIYLRRLVAFSYAFPPLYSKPDKMAKVRNGCDSLVQIAEAVSNLDKIETKMMEMLRSEANGTVGGCTSSNLLQIAKSHKAFLKFIHFLNKKHRGFSKKPKCRDVGIMSHPFGMKPGRNPQPMGGKGERLIVDRTLVCQILREAVNDAGMIDHGQMQKALMKMLRGREHEAQNVMMRFSTVVRGMVVNGRFDVAAQCRGNSNANTDSFRPSFEREDEQYTVHRNCTEAREKLWSDYGHNTYRNFCDDRWQKKYFWDNQKHTCTQYSGFNCGKSKNKFFSQDECMRKCRVFPDPREKYRQMIAEQKMKQQAIMDSCNVTHSVHAAMLMIKYEHLWKLRHMMAMKTYFFNLTPETVLNKTTSMLYSMGHEKIVGGRWGNKHDIEDMENDYMTSHRNKGWGKPQPEFLKEMDCDPDIEEEFEIDDDDENDWSKEID